LLICCKITITRQKPYWYNKLGYRCQIARRTCAKAVAWLTSITRHSPHVLPRQISSSTSSGIGLWNRSLNEPKKYAPLSYVFHAELSRSVSNRTFYPFNCTSVITEIRLKNSTLRVLHFKVIQVKVKKVKEANLYSAFIEVPYTQGAQVRITHDTQCYLQITPYLPLPRKHSPDGASQTEVADI